jgi:hypothetical protein
MAPGIGDSSDASTMSGPDEGGTTVRKCRKLRVVA